MVLIREESSCTLYNLPLLWVRSKFMLCDGCKQRFAWKGYSAETVLLVGVKVPPAWLLRLLGVAVVAVLVPSSLSHESHKSF